MKPMWTIKQANFYLKQISPLLKKAGYNAKIIGSVKNKGYSTHDLDILLIPYRNNFDFEIIMKKLSGDFTFENETYEHYTKSGRIVDFWFQ